MKITVLVDNNTLTDKYYLAEPGLSFLIETDEIKILFDVGYSDVLIKNAKAMQIELTDINYIVFSHGHLDHTWGFNSVNKLFDEFNKNREQKNRPTVLAHTTVFSERYFDNDLIGANFNESSNITNFDYHLVNEPYWITDKLVFLGEIKRVNSFENKDPIGKVIINNIATDDYIIDDTAIAYKSEKGLVIITGCSHSGICNIVEQAKLICNEDRVFDVFGGFHLLDPTSHQLNNTLAYFKQLNLNQLHPCHCVDLQSKIALSSISNVKEVGVGLEVYYQ